MRLLLTDPARGVMVLDTESGAQMPLDCPFACPCCPCAGHELLLCGCRRQRDVACYDRRTLAEVTRMPALPALSALLVSPCGRFVYQLGEETDCVHARLTATGELLCACEQGVFPRDLRLHASGRYLLLAGGASGEFALLRAPSLTVEATLVVDGAACAAAFWRDGLALLCAVEDGAIRTTLCVAGAFTSTPTELLRFDGQPGGLCVCEDGVTALIGTLAGVFAVSLATGRVLKRVSACPLCARIERRFGATLLSDALDGQVTLIRGGASRTLLASPDAQACFL